MGLWSEGNKGAAESDTSFLAVALFASTLQQDLKLFESMAATGIQSYHVHELCMALKGADFVANITANSKDSLPVPATRAFADDLCAFLIDQVMVWHDEDNRNLQPLEETVWELAILWNLDCCDPGLCRPLTSLTDDDFQAKVELVANATNIRLPTLKRLLQDPRWGVAMSKLPDTIFISDRQTLLHRAVEQRSEELVELLLKHGGADLSTTDLNGLYPLHLCEDPDVLRLLIRYGAQLDVKDSDGRTIWHNAAGNDDAPLLEALLVVDNNKDTALTIQTEGGKTPLAEAFYYVRELMGLAHGARSNTQEVPASISILMAESTGRPECFESRPSLLHWAAEWGIPRLVEMLRDAGFEPQADDIRDDGLSPLHYLNFAASTELIALLRPQSEGGIWQLPEGYPVLDKKGRSAAETVFLNFRPQPDKPYQNAHPSHSKPLDEQAYRALLTREVIESKNASGATLWQRFCTSVFEYLSTDREVWTRVVPSIVLAFRCLLDAGAMTYQRGGRQDAGPHPFSGRHEIHAMGSAKQGWRRSWSYLHSDPDHQRDRGFQQRQGR